MALVKLIKDGYGQVELNNVAFRRDGRIEAQCKLGPSFNERPAENGMILVVNNTKRTVDLPGKGNDGDLYALNYSAEHQHDERAKGLKNFKLEQGSYLPRLGYLAVGDKFTTNAVAVQGENEEALTTILNQYKEGTKVYGVPSGEGYITLNTTGFEENKPGLEIIAITTMPDGQPALKFQVVRA